MDITPIYELRERLKICMVAGTDLIEEDFRLKRAMEAFAPLEKASPVFGKIGDLVRQALTAESKEKGGAVLEALTLTDAVLCTQGAVEKKGELTPLMLCGAGTSETNMPCSALTVLLDALHNAGGGRYTLIMEAHGNHPEWFRDFRVKAAMVDALGAGYSELAEQVRQWLMTETPAILPLLKHGFDPKGKKEMVRRVSVIEAVAGADANDFYREQIPLAQKDVKGALIYALRLHPDNTELLLTLAKTERGNARQMACYALACQEDEAAWDYLTDITRKKPEEALAFVEPATGNKASVLVATGLMSLLRTIEASGEINREQTEKLAAYLLALPGKNGPEICACYEKMASFGKKLDIPVEKGKGVWTVKFRPAACLHRAGGYMIPAGLPFSQAVQQALFYSLILHEAPDLNELAETLYSRFGEGWFPAAMAARFLTADSASCYEMAKELIRDKKYHLGLRFRRELDPYVLTALSPITYDGASDTYGFNGRRNIPGEDYAQTFRRPLKAPLDHAFFEYAMACQNKELERLMISWVRPGDREMCEKLGQYFRQRALCTKDNRIYLEPMRRCGVTDCSGVAVQYFKGRNITEWEFTGYMNQLPGTAKDRAREGREICRLLKNGSIKGRADVAWLEAKIAEWEAAPEEIAD